MEHTENLNKIFTYARQEAKRLGNSEMMPDHLMLAILRLGEGKAFELLMQAGLDPIHVKRAIDKRLMQENVMDEDAHPEPSRTSVRIFRLATIECGLYHAEQVGTAHLLMAMLRDRINFPAMFMDQEYGINYECIERIYPKPEELHEDASGNGASEEVPKQIRFIFNAINSPEEGKQESPMTLKKYCRDLSQMAHNKQLDPVVGRMTEIDRVTRILMRRKKNNPILIGEPGVGKSAIVEGLAMRIEAGEVPALKGKHIVSLDLASMVAGTTYRGQFEERMKNAIKELKQHPEIILFIDEIHTLIGAGNAQGSLDAANILKPALARGEVQCIGATTTAEYKTSIEKDGALERRFQQVMVHPTSKEDTYAILVQLSALYGDYFGVKYNEESLRACVEMSDRYITNRSFPDKAIDVMDEAGARKRNITAGKETKTGRRPTISKDDIATVVAEMSGIPVHRVARVEKEQLKHLETSLSRRVIGQQDAIQTVVRAIQRSRVGIRDPKKPIGVFFFLGPTGVGKTHLAQCLADEMFGTDKALIRFDMSEYMEKHTVSLLVGAPPGYVAHEEGGKLTEMVRRKPYSVVLFDEIEKAHPDIFNILLQAMDEGRLTDRQGHLVDFRNTILIMTSNVGTRQLADFGSGVGFAAGEMSEAHSEHVLMNALNRTFPPEFVNRLDDVVIFKSLTKDDIRRILDVELAPLKQRLSMMGYTIHISGETMDKVLAKGMDARYGARPLKRAIQTLIEDPITQQLLDGKGKAGESLSV